MLLKFILFSKFMKQKRFDEILKRKKDDNILSSKKNKQQHLQEFKI